MKKVSVLLTASLLFSTSIFASNIDNTVIEFEKKRLSKNPNVKLVDVKINTKKELPLEGWNGYILDVEAVVQKKPVNVKDVVFSNGTYVSLELFDAKTGKSLKDLVTPTLSAKYYDKSKLIAGNHNAKDKVVVFSDPLCPFCMDFMPDVINYVNKNSDSIALYYYHFPLVRIHPAAYTLSMLMDLGRHKGMKDIELKVYEADWDKYFDSKETNKKTILDAFNKEFNVNITANELNVGSLEAKVRKDMIMGQEVMVQGTPTVFVNGQKDNTRVKFLELGKK